MSRYFLHLRDGTEEILDPEGTEHATMEALRKFVLNSVRDLISGDVMNGLVDFRFRVDAEDEAGAIVYSLPFKHAFSIIPDGA
jgi:hypothetical protein